MRPPVNSPLITSPYGQKRNFPPFGPHIHDGIDYVDKNNDRRVFAVADGVVVLDFDGYDPRLAWTDARHSLGNYIIVKHTLNGHDCFARYCHLIKNNVSHGQVIKEGFLLGEYADAGMSKGAHLHWDVYDEKWIKWTDPAKYGVANA
jgi:murein DD-endopeptidase MepM/ murein hydrolase activator NlpD